MIDILSLYIPKRIQEIADKVGLDYKDIDQGISVMISHTEVERSTHESKKVEIIRNMDNTIFLFSKLPEKTFAGAIGIKDYTDYEDSKWIDIDIP